MARLEHQHIVQVFAEKVDPDFNQRLLCMQLVPGIGLDKIILMLHPAPGGGASGATDHSATEWTGAELLAIIDRSRFVAGGARPLGAARSRSARANGCGRGHGLVRRPAGRGPRLRPSPRRAAPRYQAGQHPGESLRPADAGRLQHFLPAGGQRAGRRGNVRRHVRLHGTGASRCVQPVASGGPRCRDAPQRHVFAGPRAATTARRPHAVSAARTEARNRRHIAGDGGRTAASAACLQNRGTRRPKNARAHDQPLLGARAEGSLFRGRRASRAARRLPAIAACRAATAIVAGDGFERYSPAVFVVGDARGLAADRRQHREYCVQFESNRRSSFSEPTGALSTNW